MTREQLIDEVAKITDKHHDDDNQLFYRINCASEILTFLHNQGIRIPAYWNHSMHDSNIHAQLTDE